MYKNVQADKHTKERYFSDNATKRLIKEHSQPYHRKKCRPKLQQAMYEYAQELLDEAVKAMDHAGRSTLFPEDFELAQKNLSGETVNE